jgi:hypothetical protein
MTSIPQVQLPPIGGWSVTGQVQQTRALPNVPRPVDGYTISFVTGYGVNGSVFVPANQYQAATVQAAIAAQVTQLDAVSALTHTSTA